MSKLADVVYGAAVADALGVPYEFLSRDSFCCTDMVGYGTHNRPAGTWSDDTAMLLATCDSIRECNRIDVSDMRAKFVAWLHDGAYTPDGVVFDVGGTTSRALNSGAGCSGEYDNGNGSLMRIAPLALCDSSDDEICAVSAITHAHQLSKELCVSFVRLLQDALADPAGTKNRLKQSKIAQRPRDEVRSSGFVVHTFEAAQWCFANTNTYAECVCEAVNLGEDTDTTACVAGALAGAAYGIDGIPASWIGALRGKDVLESCLF